MFYRDSIDGLTWTPVQRVEPLGSPVGVAFAGRILVLFNGLAGVAVRGTTQAAAP